MGSYMYVIGQERYKEGTLGSWFLIPSDDDAWLDKEKDRHLPNNNNNLGDSLSPPLGLKFVTLFGSFVFSYLLAEAWRGYW